MPLAEIRASSPSSNDNAYYVNAAAWATAHDAASGTCVNGGGWLGGHAVLYTGTYHLYRFAQVFDLSGIPSIARFNSAKLKLFMDGYNGGGQYVEPCATDLTTAGFVNGTDFASSHFTASALCQFPKTGTAHQGYEQTLSVASLPFGDSWVLGFLAYHDRADVAPTTGDWTHWHSAAADEAYRPLLTVDYSIPDHFLDGMWG